MVHLTPIHQISLPLESGLPREHQAAWQCTGEDLAMLVSITANEKQSGILNMDVWLLLLFSASAQLGLPLQSQETVLATSVTKT